MSRLNTPTTIDAAPTATHTSLKAVENNCSVPNMFRVVANSPAALTGYLQLSAASAQGGLGTATLERIALAVAEINGCDYCLAAHLPSLVVKGGEHCQPLDDAGRRSPPARASQQ